MPAKPPMETTTPRWKALAPYCSSMNRLARAGTVNRLNPSAANPTTIIFRVRIFISRANAASSDTGAASGSTKTSSRTSRFSHWPLAGSGILNASSPMIATGTPRMKKGVRHP